ncbi:glycosyltransferase family 4 protein [Candidatus Latescibacterota bacterium]
MKATVSVNGRFWSFQLAFELQKRNYLRRLLTTYPKYYAKRYGVDPGNVKSLLIHEIILRAWKKIPGLLKKNWNTQYIFHELFDLHASYNIPEDTDIFIGWSSSCLRSLRKARQCGAKTIVERGSSHRLFQGKILREEYNKWGLNPQTDHPKIVEKELKEYEEADYIAIPSNFVKNTFLEYGVSENKLIHVPFGVDLTHFYPSPKMDDIFRVIFCGTLNIRKGIPYLLQAFSELNLKNAELWLIGTKSEEIIPFLKKYSSPNILHKGPFPEFELQKYYSQGSVFCIPSIEEGLALVQPQAMACALPLICTTNTGGSDLITDGSEGFILPIRDIEALKEKILFFYENPDDCAEMGTVAREKIKSGYTWADYGEKMMNEYKSIFNN